jgi:hypothetical protein
MPSHSTTSRLCSLSGCSDVHLARGYCNLHYLRWRLTGRTDLKPRPTIEQRFWSYVHFTPSCWEWTAYRHDGYGRFNEGSRIARVHRFAYELLVGPIPDGLTIDHLCRNRACVNPAHLEPVTVKVNVLRGEGPAAQHARKTKCPQGHPYDTQQAGGRRCSICHRNEERRRKALIQAIKDHGKPADDPEQGEV